MKIVVSIRKEGPFVNVEMCYWRFPKIKKWLRMNTLRAENKQF